MTSPGRRDRAGSDPWSARSPLRLRRLLATAGVLGCVLFGVLTLVLHGPAWLTLFLALLAALGVVDLAVVQRRLRRGDRG